MKALCWHGHGDVRVDDVAEPKIEAPTDVIIKITSTAICGSDLHLLDLDGYMPTMETGDILGHEPMGIVVEVGSAVTKVKKGDRVVVPFFDLIVSDIGMAVRLRTSSPVALHRTIVRSTTRRVAVAR